MDKKIEVKHSKFFKSKLELILYLFLMAILIILFILVGTHDYNEDQNDQEKFASEYNFIDNHNVFKYASVIDAHMIAAGKSGILFLGSSSNKWCQYYAKILNDTADIIGIDTIYYYDFYEDRKQKNATYEDILNILSDYVVYNDEGRPNLYAPTLIIVKDGKVIYFDDETAFVNGNIEPDDYWTEDKKNTKMSELQMYFLEYLGEI